MKKHVTGREKISRALLNGEIDGMTSRDIGRKYDLETKYTYALMRGFLASGFMDQKGRHLCVRDDHDFKHTTHKHKMWYFA